MPKFIWEDNIRIGPKEIGVINWIQLDQGRDFLRALVEKVLNLWIP